MASSSPCIVIGFSCRMALHARRFLAVYGNCHTRAPNAWHRLPHVPECMAPLLFSLDACGDCHTCLGCMAACNLRAFRVILCKKMSYHPGASQCVHHLDRKYRSIMFPLTCSTCGMVGGWQPRKQANIACERTFKRSSAHEKPAMCCLSEFMVNRSLVRFACAQLAQ